MFAEPLRRPPGVAAQQLHHRWHYGPTGGEVARWRRRPASGRAEQLILVRPFETTFKWTFTENHFVLCIDQLGNLNPT